MADEPTFTFHWADYLVFALSLAMSLVIGLVFMIIDCCKKRTSTEEYLMGGQRMNAVAVGFSLSASLMNAIFIIGAPAEIHYYTATYALIGVAWVPSAIIAAHVFVPLFRRMKVVSCYEYLEIRFNAPAVRIAASLTFSAALIFFLSVVLYAPAMAVMQVTGLDKTITIVVCGVVCLIYVFMGGMKAVIWTDALQMCIMIGGMLTLTIMGAMKAGGPQHVWEHALKNNRTNFDVWDIDPRTRHTFWTQTIGQIFVWAPLYGSNQMMVQRYHSVKNAFQAQVAVYASIVVSLLMLCLVTMLGFVMYDYYQYADPLLCGKISKGDQLVPYFLMEILGDYPGVPGLFVAAIFAAALSSVSSALNSLACTFLEDFIKPISKACYKNDDYVTKNGIWISRALAIVFGFITIGLSFAAEFMGAVIIQIPMTIWGMVESPLYGVFVLANFFPCANAWGAITGLLVALTINFWAAIGSFMYTTRPNPTFPLGLNCTWPPSNITRPAPPAPTESPVPYELMQFYQISYVWYGLIGLVICVVVGLVVSFIVDGIKGTASCARGATLDPTLLWPCADRCCCCCPTPCIVACRCGVPYDDDIDKDYTDKHEEYKANGMDNPSFQPESRF